MDASVLSLWACATPNRGGLDGNDLNDHGRAIFGCHGHLQSAGNASRPLYCPTRQLRRALLSCTRGTSSSSAPLTRSGTKLQLTLLAMMVVIFSICTHQLTAALGRHRVATRATAWSPGWLSPSHAGNRGSKPLRGAIFFGIRANFPNFSPISVAACARDRHTGQDYATIEKTLDRASAGNRATQDRYEADNGKAMTPEKKRALAARSVANRPCLPSGHDDQHGRGERA